MCNRYDVNIRVNHLRSLGYLAYHTAFCAFYALRAFCAFVVRGTADPSHSPQAQPFMHLDADLNAGTFAELRPAPSTPPVHRHNLVLVGLYTPLYRCFVPFPSLPDQDCAVARPLGFGC